MRGSRRDQHSEFARDERGAEVVRGKNGRSYAEAGLARHRQRIVVKLVTEVRAEEDIGSYLERLGKEEHLVADLSTKEVARSSLVSIDRGLARPPKVGELAAEIESRVDGVSGTRTDSPANAATELSAHFPAGRHAARL